jgi:hypothetical protein
MPIGGHVHEENDSSDESGPHGAPKATQRGQTEFIPLGVRARLLSFGGERTRGPRIDGEAPTASTKWAR